MIVWACAVRVSSVCFGADEIAGDRNETRTVTVFDPAKWLANTVWHDHVDTIIRVERVVNTRNAKTGLLAGASEVAFYISNEPLHAVEAAERIRAH